MKKNKIALLLAGGTGSRLNILASLRAKPAIPFGGMYRLIDFTLSNLMHSNIEVVGVLTQYKPFSLMNHIVNGQAWDFVGRMRNIEILPPHTGEKASDWYKGTADAVYQNLNFINDYDPELILIVSGDHIYKMDYNEMINFHLEKKAQLTVGLIEVPLKDASHFGIAQIDDNGRVINFEEKPKIPKNNLASMGVYVFNSEILIKRLREIVPAGGRDFAKDLIPKMIMMNRVFGYLFRGYWRDVGTIQAYWEANMDILKEDSGIDLKAWQVRTNLVEKGEIGDRPSTFFGSSARVKNSLVCRGCRINGTVINSVLSPGVEIESGVVVKDSIIFHDCLIGRDCRIERAIIDKNVRVGKGSEIGITDDLTVNRDFPDHLNTGITLIGKNVVIPEKMKIGKNCLIYPGVVESDFRHKEIASGATIIK
ncbi:MAG: sugar phosphate nucleotidyltransferase [candidate division WOR-3 bacterium]